MIIRRLTKVEERFGQFAGGVIGIAIVRWLPFPSWLIHALAWAAIIAAPFAAVWILIRRRNDRRERREAAWRTFVDTRGTPP